MTDHDVQRILKVSTTADIIGAVPAMFGFYPSESFVVVVTHGPRRRFGMQARVDLPPLAEAGDAVKVVAAQVRQQEPDGVILLCFSDDVAVADAVMAAAREQLDDLEVIDALRVGRTHYWSYLCHDDSCCPPAGTPFDVAASSVMAEMVYAGKPVLPDRAALVASVAEVAGAERRGMLRATERVWDRVGSRIEPTLRDEPDDEGHELLTEALARIDAPIARVLAGGPGLTHRDVATISVWSSVPAVRDLLWTRITRHDAHRHVALWSQIATRVVPPFEPSALSLLGFAAWLEGSGALARVALERALDADESYEMAIILRELLDHGISPDAWRSFPRAWEEETA